MTRLSKCCWISFFGGLCPDALFATQAAEMGQIPILDAFFCIESGEDVRQMAMHMNPPSEFFPGITYPFDKVEDFTRGADNE